MSLCLIKWPLTDPCARFYRLLVHSISPLLCAAKKKKATLPARNSSMAQGSLTLALWLKLICYIEYSMKLVETPDDEKGRLTPKGTGKDAYPRLRSYYIIDQVIASDVKL